VEGVATAGRAGRAGGIDSRLGVCDYGRSEMSNVIQRALDEWNRRFATISQARFTRTFNRVRGDLCEVGLLEDGRYLDRVDHTQSALPTRSREMGFVYDRGVPLHDKLLGYRTGVIYIPLNPAVDSIVPGGTLVDTIRHEFAHAWAWLDPKYIDQPWFADTFGASYDDEWDDEPEFAEDDFVSDYACTAPKEDFAETFMMFLRYRESLDRFRERRGVYRKLKAVKRAVSIAAKERVHRVRGPK